MIKLLLNIIFVLVGLVSFAQSSPHGSGFDMDCTVCHNSMSWDFHGQKSFNHDSTGFILLGQHKEVDCALCHQTLKFKDAENECVTCHTNIHQSSDFQNCDRCHNNADWMVGNINEVHQQSRFPLVGAHRQADCYDCHKAGNVFELNRVMSLECLSCHNTEYYATTSPNHIEAGYSTNCETCHSVGANDWAADGIDHSFFPLIGGHDNVRCFDCHGEGPFEAINSSCVSCHLGDYNNSTNPNHQSLGFSTNCEQCHTTDVGWSPARFTNHDARSFPIYSGAHRGEWDKCTDCHTNPSDYQQFSCINCHAHNKSAMNRKHDDERGYVYESSACYSCHPRGREDDD